MENNYPTIVGLAGQALTGKTVTGNGFAPLAQTSVEEDVLWDHTYFALPLYSMASALQKIQGTYEYDRKRYEIHAILVDLFNRSPLYGAPPWDVLIELVRKIALFPVPPDGEKPRSFLQIVGSWCREIDPNCFANSTIRKIKIQYMDFMQQLRDQEEMFNVLTEEIVSLPTRFAAVVSDVRYKNEAEKIREEPGGILIKFIADEEVRQERALRRDGTGLSEKQRNHESEQGIFEIPDEWFAAIIDTSDMSVEDQVRATREVVYNCIGVPCPS